MKVELATSIKYGNYKYCRANAENITHMVHKYWHSLTSKIDCPVDLTVHIRPIKGGTIGRACYTKHRIEIDPRRAIMREIFETLAHEMCHFEQRKQGRLAWNKEHGQRVWNGAMYRRTSTHRQYLNLPWEIEAREYGARFVREIYDAAQ